MQEEGNAAQAAGRDKAMELRLMAVGDVLTHLEIVRAASEKGYSMLFENMKELFARADILVGNQETTLTDRVAPRGFPKFATPTGVGLAEEEAGFDLITLATNHTLDLGRKGMADAVGFWRGRKAAAVGIRRKKDGGEFSSDVPYVILERNGIRVAFLNYTEPTNLRVNPLGGEYEVSLLRKRRKPVILREIRAARERADFTVVCAHWGIEYLYEPVESQKEWAAFLAGAGADLIIGTHPHVVEPLSSVETSDGRRVPVFYSLGNFISCQCFPGTMLGGLADVRLTVENGRKTVDCALIPLIAHADPDQTYFSTYPLETYDRIKANRITADIAKEFGQEICKETVLKLFDEIQAGTAAEKAVFHTSRDVRKYNAGRILKLLKKQAPH